jgi:hypothetical protein
MIKTRTARTRSGGATLPAAVIALVGAACSGEDTVVIGGAPTPVAPGPNEPPGGPAPEAPLYALHVTQLDPEDNYTTYILLSDTLDLTSVSLDRAREFPGYASIAAVDDRLLVASFTEPSVTSYTATPALDWVDGDTVSFAAYGVRDAGFWNQFFVNDNTAYVSLDITSRVVWDPTAMEIRGLVEDSTLELMRDGLVLEPTVNRQARPPVPPILRPFYYHDSDYFMWGATTPIAVYDPQTHEEMAIVDAPCPALEVESRDEAGNTYFSAWTYGHGISLYGVGPRQCVARITPDNTLDETWNPDLRSWAEGRELAVFRYMRDNKAIATVLEPGEVQADFSGEYDPDVDDALTGDVWRLWLFDLETQTARPIDGIGAMNRTFNSVAVDGRTFIMLPYNDYGNTRVVEIDTNGVATERFNSVGTIWDWVRVR